MDKHNRVFLLLGSNIDPRYNYIKIAEEKINRNIGRILQNSIIYESEAVGFITDKLFLNKVLLIETELSALKILNIIHIIEKSLGRVRNSLGYASRTIDIDILYYNNDIISSEILTLPHKRLHERKFTLLPLADIAPDYINPVLKMNNKELLELCTDNSEVTTYKHP